MVICYFAIRYSNKISWGKNVIINHKFSFSGKGKLIISDNVNLWAHEESNRFQTFSPEAKITIGKNSRINGGFFQCRDKIILGENCLVGSCHIMDTDFHHANHQLRNSCKNIPTKKIIIGKNVWLATKDVMNTLKTNCYFKNTRICTLVNCPYICLCNNEFGAEEAYFKKREEK